jgi:YggT family protein
MLNLNPFINLIATILSLYSLLLIVYVVMFYLIYFNVINRHNRFVVQLNEFLTRIIEPILKRIRHYIPPVASVDIAIIVLFLLIHFTQDVLYTYFYVY